MPLRTNRRREANTPLVRISAARWYTKRVGFRTLHCMDVRALMACAMIVGLFCMESFGKEPSRDANLSPSHPATALACQGKGRLVRNPARAGGRDTSTSTIEFAWLKR